MSQSYWEREDERAREAERHAEERRERWREAEEAEAEERAELARRRQAAREEAAYEAAYYDDREREHYAELEAALVDDYNAGRIGPRPPDQRAQEEFELEVVERQIEAEIPF